MMRTKRRKTKNCRKNGRRGRINELPDEILVSILERLGIRSIIKASSVSRRWYQICHQSITNYVLHWPSMFEELRPVSPDAFIAALNQLISSSSNKKSTTNLRCFQLAFRLGREHTSVIDACVQFALRRNVKELQLELSLGRDPCSDIREPDDDKYILGPAVFSEAESTQLTVLELGCCVLGKGLFHKLGLLGELVLRLVTLSESDVQSILSCCHGLETLALAECIVPDKLCFYQPGPSNNNNLRLKTVVVNHCRQLKEMRFSVSLDTMIYYGDGSVQFSFCGALTVGSMHIKALEQGIDGRSHDASLLQPLVQSCLQVAEELAVNFPTEWVHRLPTFTSVKNVKRLHIYSHKDTDFGIPKMSKILRSFPLLEFLSLTAKNGFDDDEGVPVNPQCLVRHTSLVEIRLCGFSQLLERIEFVKFLIRSAVELRKLALDPCVRCMRKYDWVTDCRHTWTWDELQQIVKLLQQDFPPTTKLDFYQVKGL